MHVQRHGDIPWQWRRVQPKCLESGYQTGKLPSCNFERVLLSRRRVPLFARPLVGGSLVEGIVRKHQLYIVGILAISHTEA